MKLFFYKRPVLVSLIILGLLFIVILIGNHFRSPEEANKEQLSSPKSVKIYSFDEAPIVRISGIVDDVGTITVQAQASGIITRAHVEVGQSVTRGTALFSISDTYLGGTVATTQRQLAERVEFFQEENENRRTDIAKTQEKDLTPQTNDDLARITRAQYRLQGSQVALDIDTATLQSQQARINESRFYPSSPLTGTVERVFANFGDTITAGTPLAVIRGKGNAIVTATLPQSLASLIDVEKSHFLILNDERIEVTPRYLSQTSTDGANYSIVFEIPESVRDHVANNTFVPIEITLINDPSRPLLIPLDSVIVSGNASFVFVEENGIAREREIKTGIVVGNFVTVTSGLETKDRIIVNRSISDGNAVQKQ